MKALAAVLILLSLRTIAVADDVVSLNGRWRFELDRRDDGIADRWFDHTLAAKIRLPGSLPEQGIGDDVNLQTPWTGGFNDQSFFNSPRYAKDREPGTFRIPYWLQPEKYYAGVAWYQRDIDVSAKFAGRRAVLFLERPHWETRVWVDDRLIGTNNSLGTPHEYDLGQLAPGKHVVSIRVDNRRIIDIGENSHAISDHTQGNWNGIVGRVELRFTPLTWIDDLQVYPHLASKSVTVKGKLGHAGSEKMQLTVRDGHGVVAQKLLEAGAEFSTEIPLGEKIKTWDEFHPNLYTLTAELPGEKKTVPFGMREISTEGTQFALNDRKIFIRGTLECCIFPKTGHPPTEVKEWKRILKVARDHGLNLLRFHSYCPPEAAFIAGDEMGFYFQVETCWANQSTTLGDGLPVDQWVYDETTRILKAYGNHPSFLLMPYGNEPGGKHVSNYLTKYVEHFKAEDSRRLWTSGSGWPQLAANQFDITPDPRIQAWGEELNSRINAKPPETTTDYRDYIGQRQVPVISHEIGEWCAFPNFDEIPKYSGYLQPKNFGIFRDTLKASGLGDLAYPFLIASGKLQALCYKEDIESALRTPGMGGFELLDLHDFPGQGTALVGVLDPFWEDKGYITAGEYRRFCNTVVPLARLPKRVFTVGENLSAAIEVANFSDQPMSNAETTWKLVDDNNKIVAGGKLPRTDIPIGNGISLGSITVDLTNVVAPGHLRLVVAVAGFENDWGVWVYPMPPPRRNPSDILVATNFGGEAKARLLAGGNVLLTIPGDRVRNYDTDPVKLGFSSIFWNTAWTGRQAPTTLGILCDPKNPALAEFPTAAHSDWQWWYLIHRAGALRLDLLPPEVKPVVRVIDDWVTSHPLALVVEGKVRRGRIVICGFDLTGNSSDPVSQQLLRSLEDYMGSAKFAPATEFSAEQVESLAVENRTLQQEQYLADISQLLQRQWPTNRTVNIVFHGHSVPAGYAKTPQVDTFNAYPHLVHVALKKRFPYAVINCIVTAIGGENSEQGAARFEHDVLALHPDVVTIDYGLNDRAMGVRRSEAAWRRMIEAARQSHVKVLLLTPSIDLKAHLDDPLDPLNKEADMIRRLASEYHIGLADSLAAFKEDIQAHHAARELMAQSNHPNRRGHELIAREIEKWFP